MIDISPAPAVAPAPGGLRRVGDLALHLAAAAGALSLVAALLFAVAGITPLVFTSGSMSPAIPTGSLALARSVPVEELTVGDVVSVPDAAGTRVTHRVVAIGDEGLTLQGDANLMPDADPYDVAEADRVLASVPHAGTALTAVTGATGRGLLLAVAALVLLAMAWPRPGRRAARHERVVVLAVLATVLGVGVGVARAPQGTSAFWTDSVAGTSTISVAQAAPERPVVTSCKRQGNSIVLTWTSVTDPTSFQVRHTDPTVEPVLPGRTRSATTQNGNFNNATGQIWVVAITDGRESVSGRFRYSGNGSSGVCVAV